MTARATVSPSAFRSILLFALYFVFCVIIIIIECVCWRCASVSIVHFVLRLTKERKKKQKRKWSQPAVNEKSSINCRNGETHAINGVNCLCIDIRSHPLCDYKDTSIFNISFGKKICEKTNSDWTLLNTHIKFQSSASSYIQVSSQSQSYMHKTDHHNIFVYTKRSGKRKQISNQ